MADALNIQINDHDAYHLTPLALDELRNVPKVPLIRIYGSLRVSSSTDLAYNVLVHVHNFYPYLYLDWWGKNETTVAEKEIEQFQSYLEECIKTSFQRSKEVDSDYDSDVDQDYHDAPESQHHYIASIILCKGTPMYGYHLGYSTKVKILFLLPLYKTRFYRLINEKKINFNRFFTHKGYPFFSPNVYEAHINLLTQFMSDFNLYGCGWLEICSCYFRYPLVNLPNVSIDSLKSHLRPFITSKNVLSSEAFPRMGRSLLEVDISTHHIINRQRLKQRTLHNSFAEFNNPTEDSEIYLTSLESTFNELKYQCTLRNATQTSQLLNKLYSKVFKNIGLRRFQKWENYGHHLELLKYVKKQNKSSNTSNVNSYYDKVVRPIFKNDTLPTSFDVVSSSSFSNLASYKPEISKDLKVWRSYDLLFKPKKIYLTPSPIEIHTLVSIQNYSYAGPSPSESVGDETPTSDNEAELFNPDIPSPRCPKTPEEAQSESGSPNIHSIVLDEHLFALTQKKQLHSLVDEKIKSFDQLLTQPLDSLVRHAYDVWEFLVPMNLLKCHFKQTMRLSGNLDIEYPDPSYYLEQDIHHKPLVFANKKIIVPFRGPGSTPPIKIDGYIPTCDFLLEEGSSELTAPNHTRNSWEFVPRPPLKNNIIEWITVTEKKKSYKANRFRSQIEPAITQTNEFKYSHRMSKISRNPSGYHNMTVFYMEIHADTFDKLRPDPNKDPISMIIYRFDDANNMFSGSARNCILISAEGKELSDFHRQVENVSITLGLQILTFGSELEMIEKLLLMIDFYDPDILAGYEINAASWGYMIERMRNVYQSNILSRLSKTTLKGNGKFGDKWGYTHTSAIKVNGRHMLNLWRILRSEVSLTSYSIENLSFHLLHRSMPRFSNFELSTWRNGGSIKDITMFCQYYSSLVDTALLILESQEVVIKNVEQSRLIGIDFNSNFYRGSQYKVESILIRIAKSENLLLNSPSKQQVHEMRALTSIPLIMEPDSNFYKSPLVVLDFQSLYPSIMIAYNYCYSTLIGKIEGFEQNQNSVGYLKHVDLPSGLVDILDKNDGINISPNGLLFVSTKFRKSILSKMLQEILNMRINTKAVASAFPEDLDLKKVCNSKQLALKLIANVTYGYTSATFSGRMPNSDIADAIVSTGREILAKSIEIIESSEFNAKVVYGDTDSLFVYFPGRSKENAFAFGRLLAQRVTEFFPDPIKLKFEKVYHPCVLLAKKRYVGNCFEFEEQVSSTFEAKGIETIRRDGIPAQQKMVGKTLRILFETKNLSKVKEYVVKQFYKIVFNRVNVKDFCFAKEVRYGTYKNEKYLPPGAILAENAVKMDPRSEPQYRERIPYLVIRDSSKERIKDRSITPEDYLESLQTEHPFELDYEYYITRVLIPPLERIFNLMGVNVKEWYRNMSKSTKQIIKRSDDILLIGDSIRRRECFRCESNLDPDQTVFCLNCIADKIGVMNDLIMSKRMSYKAVTDYKDLCKRCNVRNFGGAAKDTSDESCRNIDCLIYYGKAKSTMENNALETETSKILEELHL